MGAASRSDLIESLPPRKLARRGPAPQTATPRLRRHQLHGRSTLRWCAIVLCVSPLIGGWLVDNCPLQIRFPDAAAILERWRSAPRVDVILLGSSRLMSCVIDTELAASSAEQFGRDRPKIFNATLPWGEPIAMEFVTRRLFALRDLKPRLAVIEASSDFLARDNMRFKLIIGRQLRARDLPTYGRDIFFFGHAGPRLLASRLTPFYLHRPELLAWCERALAHLAGGDGRPADATATAPTRRPPPPPGWANELLRSTTRNVDHYRVDGATSAALERAVAELHSRGCTIVLVQPPLSSPMREVLRPQVQRQFSTFADRLRQAYGCELIDFSDRMPDEEFFDPQHISDHGRIRTTELLLREAIAPAWQRLKSQAR